MSWLHILLVLAALFVPESIAKPVQLSLVRQSTIKRLTKSAPTEPTLLTGCPFGVFSVPVIIHNTVYHLTLDTGSTTLAIAGHACSNCAGVYPLWQPEAGVSVAMGHQTSGAYGDTSGWIADTWTDTVALGDLDVTMCIAVISSQTTSPSFFPVSPCAAANSGAKVQGILGLAFTNLAVSGTDSFMEKMLMQHPHLDASQAFALQLCQEHGTLWLGGMDNNVLSNDHVIYTPLMGSNGYFQVAPIDISVGGVALNIEPTSWPEINILDSGSTLLTLPTLVYAAVVQALLSHPQFQRHFAFAMDNNFFNSQTGRCQLTTSNANWSVLQEQMPTLSLTFQSGATLVMDGVGSYIMPCDDAYSQWTPGIIASRSTHGGMVGGWPLLNQFVVLHDLNARRIGFATAAATSSGCRIATLRARVLQGNMSTMVADDSSSGTHGNPTTDSISAANRSYGLSWLPLLNVLAWFASK